MAFESAKRKSFMHYFLCNMASREIDFVIIFT